MQFGYMCFFLPLLHVEGVQTLGSVNHLETVYYYFPYINRMELKMMNSSFNQVSCFHFAPTVIRPFPAIFLLNQ